MDIATNSNRPLAVDFHKSEHKMAKFKLCAFGYMPVWKLLGQFGFVDIQELNIDPWL